MGFRKPKSRIDPKKDKAENNQSTGSACERCGTVGGGGEITVEARDGQGKTITMKQDCPDCN